LQYPLEMVGKIAAFCGLEASEAQIKQAAEVVENGSATYVRAARLEYHGFVGKLVNGQLRGWVKATTRDDIRVAVELQIDGEVVQKARADIYRPDVEQAGFGDGRYGFAFKIDDNVSRQSVVAVLIQNYPILEKNSVLPLSSYKRHSALASAWPKFINAVRGPRRSYTLCVRRRPLSPLRDNATIDWLVGALPIW
jgi:hypothetical protein